MLFQKVIDSIKNKINKYKSISRTKKYHQSAEKVFTKLYGYRRTADGKIEIVESEAKVIRLIFELLGQGKNPEQVKRILDVKNIKKNNKRWTKQQIINIASKSIYVGKIKLKSGKLIDSKYYKPIVSVETYVLVKKSLQNQNLWTESFEFSPLI